MRQAELAQRVLIDLAFEEACRHPVDAVDMSSNQLSQAVAQKAAQTCHASKVCSKLLRGGLIEEVAAGGLLPVWCRDDDAGPLPLPIIEQGLVSEVGTPLQSGDAQLGEQGASISPKNHRRRPLARQKENRGKPPQQRAKTGRNPSKQARVLAMLKCEQDTTIAAVMQETGWQQHSVRGFCAGVVRKKLGLTLNSEKNSSARVYRVVAGKRPTPKIKSQAAAGESA